MQNQAMAASGHERERLMAEVESLEATLDNVRSIRDDVKVKANTPRSSGPLVAGAVLRV